MKFKQLNEAKINTDKLIAKLDDFYNNVVMTNCGAFYKNSENKYLRNSVNEFVDFHNHGLAAVEACCLIRTFIQVYEETGSLKPLYAISNFKSSNLSDKIDYWVCFEAYKILKDVLKFKPEKYYDSSVDSDDFFKWIEV